MAEYAVGPLISVLSNKLSGYLLERYKVMDGMEEQREILERKLPAILDIIEDAEEKGAYRPGVSAWLKALKKVACEANDVFDEFKYEALRRDAKEKGHYKKLGFDIVSLFPSHNPIVFRYRMGKKLCRVVHIIEVLVAEMNALGFKHLKKAPPSKQWRNTDSVIIDSNKDIVSRSRDVEKKKIVNILIDQASNRKDLIVLPIVGMGGLGKTTFAQLVYNDSEIKEHFKLRRWCCVSDDFNVAEIANNISQTSEKDCDKALQNLQNEIRGKRYLIVLDDVWDEDSEKWKKLRTCLKHGGKGSAILITTRKEKVAQIMKMCVDDSHNLGKLPKVYLKEIFENRAFCLLKPNAAKLSGMVERILDRCGGSPLAAKAFGSMLSTKTSMKEWTDLLNRSNNCNVKTETLPILKLSYDDLPSHLKQCFAFCAIFPKDYEIDVEILIQLWMAHDFIPLKEDDNLEKVGREIFDELTWRSFFQDVKRILPERDQDELRSRTVCKIHDLMHDIALSVMGKDCLTIVDRPNQKELLSAGPTRHLFSSYQYIGTPLDNHLKKQSPALQTLLYTDSKSVGPAPHLLNYSNLRALQLFELRKLPLQPRHLQHLRYLDLSNNELIKELPKEISILYNLQTLKLSNCERLCRLPKDMKYMTNLRHLYTSGCISLVCMPPDLGQLTSLQTLTYFVADSSPGCSTIRELQYLSLGGELQLSCLEYVTEEHAKASSLGNKDKVTHLYLAWSDGSIDELDQHRNVLDALKPHAALEFLGIYSYGGTAFPAWVTSLTFLQHLTELRLDGCTMCEEFPEFCEFKALEVLVLKRLKKLQSLCSHSSSAPFPALKDLIFENLEIFERWVATEEELIFPQLENVRIENCPKLTTLPEAPKLKVLDLEEDKAQLSLSILRSRYMSYLSELLITVSDTEAIPTPKLDQNPEISLSNMVLTGCHFLFPSSPLQPAVGFWKWFGQLVSLHIYSCDTLIYWPEEVFLILVSLKNLYIRNCSKLIGLTQVKGCCIRGRGQYLPNLSVLIIKLCESLTELFVLPPSLTTLIFDECHSIEFIPVQDDELECLQHFDIATSSEHCNDLASENMPEQSDSPKVNPLPCLEFVTIQMCNKIRSVPAQMDALKSLRVRNCSGLESLDCLGDLPLLETLFLVDCKHLASVPGSTGNYSALERIIIRYCPAVNMKAFYGHLQQRLDSLECKDLSDAGSSNPREGPKLWEPKSWKYVIPGPDASLEY